MSAADCATASHPHFAAVNEKPWRRFRTYALALAFVSRRIKSASDKGWVRCAVCLPAPKGAERRAK